MDWFSASDWHHFKHCCAQDTSCTANQEWPAWICQGCRPTYAAGMLRPLRLTPNQTSIPGGPRCICIVESLFGGLGRVGVARKEGWPAVSRSHCLAFSFLLASQSKTEAMKGTFWRQEGRTSKTFLQPRADRTSRKSIKPKVTPVLCTMSAVSTAFQQTNR